MKDSILANGLEAVENDVYARTRMGRSATLCARVALIQGAIVPRVAVRLGVLGSPVWHEVHVTADDFHQRVVSLSAVESELDSIAYGLGKLFGLDVAYGPQCGANTQSWIFTAETAENDPAAPRSPKCRERSYRAAASTPHPNRTLVITAPRTLGSLMDSDMGTDITVLAALRVRGTLTEFEQGLVAPGASRRSLTRVRLSTDAGFARTYDSTTLLDAFEEDTPEPAGAPSNSAEPTHNPPKKGTK